MTPNLYIRPAVRGDIPAVLSLLRELAEFERLRDRVAVTESLMAEHLFGENRFAEALLALVDRDPVGYALFYPVLPSFGGRPWLFLEDLYVRPEARRYGVGRAMMARLARVTRSRGWTAMAWNVLEWNTAAFAFYEQLGAVRSEVSVQMELRGEALERLSDLASA